MKIDFCHFCLFVCLFVCPFFSPPSHGPISNLITFLEFLHHGSANKIVCSPVEAKIKKKLARKLFFSSRNVFLYVTEFFLYVTYKSKCGSKNKFYFLYSICIEQLNLLLTDILINILHD